MNESEANQIQVSLEKIRKNKFQDLIKNCTKQVSGYKNNCAIYSLQVLFSVLKNEKAKILREKFAIALSNLEEKTKRGYFNNNDFQEIKNEGSMVDWTVVVAAAKALTNESVYVVTHVDGRPVCIGPDKDGFSEVIETKKMKEALNNDEKFMILSGNHYTPLIDNKKFLSGLNKLGYENINSLHDLVDETFSGDKNSKVKSEINDIIKECTNESDRNNMELILLGGIVAQYEHEHTQISISNTSNDVNNDAFVQEKNQDRTLN